MHYTEKDLIAFKSWLKTFAVPCSRCSYRYEVPQATIDLVELSEDEERPFKFNTHDIYACTNPDCAASFSYPDTEFNRVFLKSYRAT